VVEEDVRILSTTLKRINFHDNYQVFGVSTDGSRKKFNFKLNYLINEESLIIDSLDIIMPVINP